MNLSLPQNNTAPDSNTTLYNNTNPDNSTVPDNNKNLDNDTAYDNHEATGKINTDPENNTSS